MSEVVNFKLVGQGLTADDFKNVPLTELFPLKEKQQKFIEAAYQVSRMPQFAGCLSESLVGAIVKAATLGLSISPELGQCYLLPATESDRSKPKDKSGYFPKLPYSVVQFQIGYRGWKELAFDAGVIESLNPGIYFDGDEFTLVKGSKDIRGVRHVPKYKTEKLLAAYCVVDFKGGGNAIYDLSANDIERLRKKNKSQQYNNFALSGAWLTDYAMMGLAKVIKGALDKLTPAFGSRLAQALIYDETSTNRTVDGEIIEEKTETHELRAPSNATKSAGDEVREKDADLAARVNEWTESVVDGLFEVQSFNEVAEKLITASKEKGADIAFGRAKFKALVNAANGVGFILKGEKFFNPNDQTNGQ